MKRRVVMKEYTESFRLVEGNYEIIMKQGSELHMGSYKLFISDDMTFVHVTELEYKH